MFLDRLHRPRLVGGGADKESDSALIAVCGVCAVDVIVQGVSSVDFGVDACFGRNTEIDLLLLECATERDQSAIATIADVIGGYLQGGRGCGCG